MNSRYFLNTLTATVPSLALFLTLFFISCEMKQEDIQSLNFTRISNDVQAADSSSSPSASWIDFDNDGDDDLYVLNGFATLENPQTPQKNRLYRNDGTGNFYQVKDHPLIEDITFSGSGIWGDYDNDGDPDLFVANQKNADNYLYRNDGESMFTRITEGIIVNDGGQSFSASWVDIDNDGWLDLHVMNGRSNPDGQRDFLYRNIENGKFEKVTGTAITSDSLRSGGAAWADFDADGDQDVVIPVNSNAEKFRVYRNEGNWNFTAVAGELNLSDDPLPFSPATSVAHWVDYDNDLDFDLFIGNANSAVDYLYQNDGTGRFKKVTAGRLGLDATYVSDVTWTDLNLDGHLDYVIAVWGGASEIHLNNGNSEFYPVYTGDFGSNIHFASSVTANDVDSDGDPDLYLTQWPINEAGGTPNLFFLNQIDTGNWIKIDLEGTESNRSGIGAKIIVTTLQQGKEHHQLRQVRSRTSWRSSSGLTQLIGLGDVNTVEEILVQWPSGHEDRIRQIGQLNQTLVIVEGQGLTNLP